MDIILLIVVVAGFISVVLIRVRAKIAQQMENHIKQNYNKYYNEKILGKPFFCYKVNGCEKKDKDSLYDKFLYNFYNFFYDKNYTAGRVITCALKDKDFPHDEFLDKNYTAGRVITYALIAVFIIILYVLIVAI